MPQLTLKEIAAGHRVSLRTAQRWLARYGADVVFDPAKLRAALASQRVNTSEQSAEVFPDAGPFSNDPPDYIDPHAAEPDRPLTVDELLAQTWLLCTRYRLLKYAVYYQTSPQDRERIVAVTGARFPNAARALQRTFRDLAARDPGQ